MAITIQQCFDKLRHNLEITDLQEDTVSSRQQSVRRVIECSLNVMDTFLTGSYRRNTMIAPLKQADVDIFVVLHPKHYDSRRPQALLEETRAALRKTYTRTPEISPNGQAVTIQFDDFKVDVVPGFQRQGGGYLIPDGPRVRWIATDPKKHIEIWSARNKIHNGDLVPMIKILKGWNKSTKVLRSFHLEVMALSVFHEITISDFPSGARFFFDKAREKVSVQLADPAGYNADIASHVASQAQYDNIRRALDTAYRAAVEAEQWATKGYNRAAIDEWRKIFPEYCPAYG